MPAPRNAPTQTRRTVLRTAAWSAPVVAVAAATPAHAAASPCEPQAYTAPVTSANYTRTSTSAGSGTVALAPGGAAGATTFAYSVTSTLIGSALRYSSNLAQINASARAGGSPVSTVWDAYQYAAYGEGQVFTWTFARPVSNISLVVIDIDSNTPTVGFRDAVSTSPSPVASSIQFANASYLQGSGTPGSPFQTTSGQGSSGTGSSNGNVTFQLAGPLTQFTLTYTNSRPASGRPAQAIGMAITGLEASGCGPTSL